MRAAIYCRVSTEEQAAHGYSLEAQRDEGLKYITDHGYELHEIYVDDGYSAKNMDRPALQRMLNDCKARKIDIVIFWNVDRLTRDTVDGLIMCRDTFFRKGIKFVSLTEKIDISSADGEMMFTIRLSMAQAERRRIGERTRIGYATRAKKGGRNSPSRPYGYQIGPDIVLIVDEEEKKVVQQIFDWYLSGYGTTKIARELNILGIVGPRGGKWNHVAIQHILRNITYLGYNHWKDSRAEESERIIVKGNHEAIIAEATFQQAQDQVSRRSSFEMSRTSRDYYYSSILKCAECGKSFSGKLWVRGEQRVKRYKCLGRQKIGDCKTPEITESKVTEMVFHEWNLKRTEGYDTNRQIDDVDALDVDKQRKALQREIDKHKAEYERLVSLFMADKIDLDIYEKKRDQVKNRITEAEEKLSELPSQQITKRTKGDFIKLIEQLQENWDYLTESERKMVIQRLYKEIKIRKVDGMWKIVGMVTAN